MDCERWAESGEEAGWVVAGCSAGEGKRLGAENIFVDIFETFC
jgi:hypothetical protein